MAKTKTDAMSKYDAVCATLRDGVTRPTDGVVHALGTYGVEMTPNQFSAHKSRAVLEGVIPAEPAAKQAEAQEPKAVQQDAPKPKPPTPAPKAEAKPAAPTPPAPKPPKPEVKSPPKAEPEAAPAPKPVVKAPPAASPADLARQVKQLVARHGADAVADMVGVFKD